MMLRGRQLGQVTTRAATKLRGDFTFSWLKVLTSAFTLKTLLRHNAKIAKLAPPKHSL